MAFSEAITGHGSLVKRLWPVREGKLAGLGKYSIGKDPLPSAADQRTLKNGWTV